MVYQFAHGAKVSTRAQVVGETLSAIQEKRGGLRPSEIVEEARPVESPIHACFEWDESEAAQKYRLWQARQLISCVVMVRESPELPPVRAFVNVRQAAEDSQEGQKDSRVYLPLETVLASPDLRQQAINAIKSDIASLRRKMVSFERLASAIHHIDAIEESVELELIAA
jgi:hypothetical protein